MQRSTEAERNGRILVLASINADQFIYVDELPSPGETVLARAGASGLGGKGANQSVAAALLGAEVAVIGRVGDDDHGSAVRAEFERLGLSTALISSSEAEPTGAAFIMVAADGQNTIAVLSGANSEVTADDIDAVEARTAGGPPFDIGLTQGELSASSIERFAAYCRTSGTRFVLNLAPTIELDRDVLSTADPLIVNEGEAAALASRCFDDDPTAQLDVDQALALAARLAASVVRSVIITLGADGAVAAEDGEVWHQPAPVPGEIVDSTGAGDAFVGAAAVALSRSRSMSEAVGFGVAAGSYSVAHRGTVLSYPDSDQLEALLPSLETAEPRVAS